MDQGGDPQARPSWIGDDRAAPLFPRRPRQPRRRRRPRARGRRRRRRASAGRRRGLHGVFARSALCQRQGRSDRLLLGRASHLSRRLFARRHRRGGGLLGRQRHRRRPQAAQRQAPAGAHRSHGEAALSAARPVRQRRRKSQPRPGEPHRSRAQKARQDLRVLSLRRRRTRLFQRRAAGLSPGAGARRLEQGVYLLPQTSRHGGRGARGLRCEEIIHVLLHRREGQALGQRQGAERLDADRHRQRLLRSSLPCAARSCARHRLHQRSGRRSRARHGGIERGLRARAGYQDPRRLGQRRGRARQGGAPRRGAGPGGVRVRREVPDNRGGTTMTVMARTRFDVVPLSKHIGAEIRGLDLREKPDDETVAAIYQAWLDHLVIVFPGQKLSQENLIRATGYFGELGELSRPPKYFPKGYSSLLPGIMLISNIRENGEPIGALPDGEMMFHHDMIHAEVPSKATLLYSVEIPSTGGNTLFASGYAAYDTLDPALRDQLEGHKAMHHYNYGSTQKGDSRGTVAFAECTHPVFRTHEDTGRKAVYVNRLMTTGIIDMPPAESEPLLNAVFDHAEKREFV